MLVFHRLAVKQVEYKRQLRTTESLLGLQGEIFTTQLSTSLYPFFCISHDALRNLYAVKPWRDCSYGPLIYFPIIGSYEPLLKLFPLRLIPLQPHFYETSCGTVRTQSMFGKIVVSLDFHHLLTVIEPQDVAFSLSINFETFC